MLFTQGTYFIFLLAVFFLYWLIAERVQWRKLFLLAASYFFYAQAGWSALLLLAGVSTVDFLITRALHRNEQPRRRKFLLALSLTTNLGVLCLFKYADFFLTSSSQAATKLGWQLHAQIGRASCRERV